MRMSAMRTQVVCCLLVAAFLLLAVFPYFASAQGEQADPAAKGSLAPDQETGREVVAGPKDSKERTAVYVFVIWMWSSIIVLLFILRAKVKEADRLHDLQYYQDKDPAKE